MMKKNVFFPLLISMFFLFGCIAVGQSKGFDLERIKAMVDDPNVEIASENFSAGQMQQKLAEFNPQCNNKLSAKAYSAVYVTSKEVDLTLFIDPESDEIECTIRKEKATDQCVTDKDCDDGLASTIDECKGEPLSCSNERISECVSGDSYCPQNCTKKLDFDCKRECIVNSDCDDANSMTTDSCRGLFKTCQNVPIDIEALPVIKTCEADMDCDDKNICTIDVCNEEKICSHSNEVNGTVCDLKKECFGGECVDNALNKIKILDVKIKALSENSVEITWKTNKLGKSEVKFGLDVTYQESEENNTKVTDHKIVLENLKKNKEYLYKIFSEDAAGLAIAQYTAFTSFFTCQNCTGEQTCDISNGQCVLG